MNITIITSVLNCKNALTLTINQMRPLIQEFDLEYIIIDGGSTDGTLDVIKQNKHLITHFISEPDNGIYDAWNKALKLASGDYISFVGAGDYYIDHGFRSIITQAKSNPEADIILGKINIVEGNRILYCEGENWTWNKFRRYMHIDHPGAFHSKKLFERYGSFNSSFKIAGDYEFLLRAGSSLKTNFVNEVILNMQAGGISHANSRVLKEVCRAKIINNSTSKFVSIWDYCISSLLFKIRILLFK